MKKKLCVFMLIVGFILGACAAAGVYFLTVGEVPWREYVEMKLIPNAVLAVTTVGSLCAVAFPVVREIKLAASGFKDATGDVNKTVEKGRDTERRLSEQDKKIDGYGERMDLMEQHIIERLAPMLVTAENTEKIVRLGFCNTEEIVRKGYANEIEKVGKHDE